MDRSRAFIRDARRVVIKVGTAVVTRHNGRLALGRLCALCEQVSDEELDMEVDNAIEGFKRFDQEYDEARVREQAQELLEGSKVLDCLTEHAEITYEPKQS